MESTGSLWVECGTGSATGASGRPSNETASLLAADRVVSWLDDHNFSGRYLYRIWQRMEESLLPYPYESASRKPPKDIRSPWSDNAVYPNELSPPGREGNLSDQNRTNMLITTEKMDGIACPTLTEGSTLSDPTCRLQRSHAEGSLRETSPNDSQEPAIYQRQTLVSPVVSSSDNRSMTEKQQKDANAQGRLRTKMPIGSAELKLPPIPDATVTDRPDKMQIDHDLAVDADISPGCGESASDPCSEFDTSSKMSSDDEDFFEGVNHSIRAILGQNRELADRVIAYLFRLSHELRAIVYQFGESSGQSGIYVSREHDQNSTNAGDKSSSKKRKHDRSRDSGHHNGRESGEKDDQDDAHDNPPGPARHKRRFACAFNIYDKNKYCPQDIEGPEATRYKSCAGPGFLALNHYKRHLERHHIIHQCSRCGQILEKLGDLESHLAQDTRCERIDFVPEYGMSQSVWDDVKVVFRRTGKGQKEITDETRWYKSWDIIFPMVPRPETPYYESIEPTARTYPLQLTRIQEMFRAILTFLPRFQDNQELILEATTALEQAIAIIQETSNDVVGFEQHSSRENLEGINPASFNPGQQTRDMSAEDALLNYLTGQGAQDNPDDPLPEGGDLPAAEGMEPFDEWVDPTTLANSSLPFQ